MSKTLVKVGPADHGRRMSLDDFDRAEGQEGYLYELNRGVVVVSDVPKRRHLVQVRVIRKQLTAYDLAHPGVIDTIAAGSECKIVLADLQSERHADLSIYKTPCTAHDEDTLWQTWVPEVAIEVVSPGSEQRDYEEKPDEYFRFGVREYWIVDADRQEMLVLKRWGSRWREHMVRPPQPYSTRLLPGFALDLAAVFAAAAELPE
jgi:Uma2 family endonuclease